MKMETQSMSVSSSGAHIRSRITVVCAECKRLKLKCDRRTPCSSCIKRDTVPRCLYSAAAAEKIDVQSLHNRVLLLEGQLAQYAAQGFTPRSGPNSLFNDRALIATSPAGSSIVISLDDVAGIWLDTLDLTTDEHVRLAPLPPPVPPATTSLYTDVDFSVFKFPSGEGGSAAGGGGSGVSGSMAGGGATASIGVTPQLVQMLPQHPQMREDLLRQLEATLELHPCFNFPHFKGRVLSLFRYADSVGGNSGGREENERDLASSSPPAQGSTLSFFSAAAAGLALASRIASRNSQHAWSSSSSSSIPQPPPSTTSTNPPSATASPSGYNNMTASPPSRSTHTSPIPTNPSASQAQAQPTTSTNNPSHLPSPPHISRNTLSGGLGLSLTTTTSTPPPSQKYPSPSSLFTLSHHALTLHELNNPYDLDYLVALLLQALFLLHDGLPSVPHTLFPTVGKMVNVARMMGLYIDPDESIAPGGIGPKYGLFESEMRRRIWWDVYYYDLFVSDAMGQAPLIQDDVPSCRHPADVNESSFAPASITLPPPTEGGKNFSFFGQKCRLAQLVKTMKKRTFIDPFRPTAPPTIDNPHPTSELSIDAAISFESEVAAWVADLPPLFKLDMLQEDMSLLIQGVPPVLVAQRCQIATITARLVIKLFVPFLKRSRSSGNGSGTIGSKPPHHAVHACVNAAHTILHASRVAATLFKQRSRVNTASDSLFYSFGRQLFDAAVISAHSVITAPQSLFAKVAMEDLKVALEIMRDPSVSTGRGPIRGGVEGSPSEALRIVELLQAKAEAARSGVSSVLGVKRKHSEVEETFQPGFQLPYVGAAVVTASSTSASVAAPPPSSAVSVGSAGSSSTRAIKYAGERRDSNSGRERMPKAHYPPIGVRVRTNSSGKNSEGGRSRGNSVVTTSSRAQAQAAQLPSAGGNTSTPTSASTTSPRSAAPPSASSMPPPTGPPDSLPFPTSSPQTTVHQQSLRQPPSMQTEPTADYSNMPTSSTYGPQDSPMMHYHNEPPSSYQPSPSPQRMYDTTPVYSNGAPAAPPSSGPVASSNGTYYIPTPASYATANSGGYDSGLGSHAHTHVNIPMLNMSHPHPHPHSHTNMDTSGSMQESVPNTPRDVYPPGADKGHTVYKTDADDPGIDPMVGINYSMSSGGGAPAGWVESSSRYPQTAATNWGNYPYWKEGA